MLKTSISKDCHTGLMNDYLQRILRARVYDVAKETPLELGKNLSNRLNNRIWLKREDLQPVFSFKLRGAYNRMAQLDKEDLKRGVIASSAGNHAQGVALSASFLKCKAVIVMPITTPETKIKAVVGTLWLWQQLFKLYTLYKFNHSKYTHNKYHLQHHVNSLR